MASVAANAALRTPRSLRVIALPLTRAPHQFTYYHFVNPPSTISKNANSLVNRAVVKALDVWAGFGKAQEGSWKVCRLMLFPPPSPSGRKILCACILCCVCMCGSY